MAEETTNSGGPGGAALFFLILGGLFVLWVFSGGPEKQIASGGFFLTSPQPISTGETTQTGTPLDFRAPSFFPRIGTRDEAGTSRIRDRELLLELERNPGTISPLAGTVEINRHREVDQTDPEDEYLELRLSSRADNGVSITGWSLVSPVSGKRAVIPQGVRLPFSGTSQQTRPIVLEPGDEAYIITGRSPLGISFQENICTGYFEQFQDFTPSLPLRCPLPEDELATIRTINSAPERECRRFARSMDRCTIETDIDIPLQDWCDDFIEEELNYNGCVQRNQADEDFFSGNWHVYLSQDRELWKSERELIRLLDAQGRVVDQVSY